MHEFDLILFFVKILVFIEAKKESEFAKPIESDCD